jgi:hypothetical protein
MVCCPATHVVVEPKAKKKYKTKKEKENDVVMEELVITARPWLVANFMMKRPKV